MVAYSVLHSDYPVSEAQPRIQWVPGVKRPGPEADDSLPSSAEIKNNGAILPLPHTSCTDTALSSETFVDFYRAARRHIPEASGALTRTSSPSEHE
jgi:hypothetical protein